MKIRYSEFLNQTWDLIGYHDRDQILQDIKHAMETGNGMEPGYRKGVIRVMNERIE